jgi:hypothetical protein
MIITEQIINLKKHHNLLEIDVTESKQSEWYAFLLSQGLIDTVYDNNGNLLGFCEYVYLDKIPKSWEEVQLYSSDFVSGKILFVCNAISDCKETLWKLKRKLFRKNRGMEYLVWHSKSKDEFIVFSNIRKGIKYANALSQ